MDDVWYINEIINRLILNSEFEEIIAIRSTHKLCHNIANNESVIKALVDKYNLCYTTGMTFWDFAFMYNTGHVTKYSNNYRNSLDIPFIAAKSGQLDILRKLKTKFEEVDSITTDISGIHPNEMLIIALYNGNIEMAKFAVEILEKYEIRIEYDRVMMASKSSVSLAFTKKLLFDTLEKNKEFVLSLLLSAVASGNMELIEYTEKLAYPSISFACEDSDRLEELLKLKCNFVEAASNTGNLCLLQSICLNFPRITPLEPLDRSFINILITDNEDNNEIFNSYGFWGIDVYCVAIAGCILSKNKELLDNALVELINDEICWFQIITFVIKTGDLSHLEFMEEYLEKLGVNLNFLGNLYVFEWFSMGNLQVIQWLCKMAGYSSSKSSNKAHCHIPDFMMFWAMNSYREDVIQWLLPLREWNWQETALDIINSGKIALLQWLFKIGPKSFSDQNIKHLQDYYDTYGRNANFCDVSDDFDVPSDYEYTVKLEERKDFGHFYTLFDLVLQTEHHKLLEYLISKIHCPKELDWNDIISKALYKYKAKPAIIMCLQYYDKMFNPDEYQSRWEYGNLKKSF